MKITPQKNIVILLPVVIGAILFANYIYTFSGFVSYTSTERRAGALLEEVYKIDDSNERKKFVLEKLQEEEQELFLSYARQFQNTNQTHKTVQQFYVEQLLLLIFGGLLVFIFKSKKI